MNFKNIKDDVFIKKKESILGYCVAASNHAPVENQRLSYCFFFFFVLNAFDD